MKKRLTSWKTTITGIVLVVVGGFLMKINESVYSGLCITAGLVFLGAKDPAKKQD